MRCRLAKAWVISWVLFVAVLLAACTAVENNPAPVTPMQRGLATAVSRATPPLAPPLATLTPAPSAQPIASQPATAAAVPTPSARPTAKFCCLRFATAVADPPRAEFAAGTEEIYALWDYQDMVAEDRIRRIWFRDDLIWLTREETWPWAQYGEAGTVEDIAIYDREGDGLVPAHYRLQLYVNDVLEQEGTFTITSP